MANSIRERILQALATKLTAVATANGAQFFRQPVTGIVREQTPALILEVQQEVIQPRTSGVVDRELTVRVLALVRNIDVAAGFAAADALIVAAHATVMSDPNVGGLALALREESGDWVGADADAAVAEVPAVYLITYRTRTTDLTVSTQ
ncbi:MAG: hypothetical protein KGI52_07065 [Burkholderiales bacterium]|nr:hypothetical protein [Burkholderiales bacterium]